MTSLPAFTYAASVFVTNQNRFVKSEDHARPHDILGRACWR